MAGEVEKKLAFGFEAMGEQRVKNISEPIPAYRVRFDGAGPPTKRKNGKPTAPSWPKRVAAAIIVVVGAAAAAWYGLPRLPNAHLAGARVPSIAVLPFDDMSPDKSSATWATG